MGMGKTEGTQKAFKAGAAIGANLIVQFGTDDDHVVQAAAVEDAMIGISQHAAAAAEESLRVMIEGITDVVLGGTVTRGDKLTADENGRAVTAAPAAGANANIIGMAGKSGVTDDIVPMILAPSTLQGV